jgi:hypothetical protein
LDLVEPLSPFGPTLAAAAKKERKGERNGESGNEWPHSKAAKGTADFGLNARPGTGGKLAQTHP